jgi:hypothetical protein
VLLRQVEDGPQVTADAVGGLAIPSNLLRRSIDNHL